MRRPSFWIGITFFSLIVGSALLAPVLTSQSPNLIDLAQKLRPPSSSHFLGTDGNGVDVWAQLVFGARLSLRVAFMVALISVVIGGVIGSLAGYFGGLIDDFMMRVIEILYAFPGFLLALSMIAFLGSSVRNVITALCITGWTSYARLIRAEVAKLKTQDFVEAAHAIGASDFRIVMTHLWPNLFNVLAVQVSFGLAATVISEAGLSFLGLGAPPSEASWGALLASGRKYLLEAPHISLSAAFAVLLLVLSINLIGDGLSHR